jgi:hypothetical protein
VVIAVEAGVAEVAALAAAVAVALEASVEVAGSAAAVEARAGETNRDAT